MTSCAYIKFERFLPAEENYEAPSGWRVATRGL